MEPPRKFKTLSSEDLQNLRLRYKPTLAAMSGKPFTVGTSGNDNTDNTEAEGGEESRSGKRKKYTCGCGCNVWGKSGLILKCGICGTDFIEQ